MSWISAAIVVSARACHSGGGEDPGAQQGELVERGQRVLLAATPAAVLVVVGGVELGPGGAAQGDEVGVRGCGRGARASALEAAGSLLGDQLAQQGGELGGLLEAAQLEHGAGVAGEHGGGGPAPLGVALGEVGAGVGVDADRHEVVAQQRGDLRVGVGAVVHHVTPVTPAGGDVHQQDPSLAGGGGEALGSPLVPGEARGGGGRRARGERRCCGAGVAQGEGEERGREPGQERAGAGHGASVRRRGGGRSG
nr:hypothetical protein [Nannocystis sp.]